MECGDFRAGPEPTSPEHVGRFAAHATVVVVLRQLADGCAAPGVRGFVGARWLYRMIPMSLRRAAQTFDRWRVSV